MRGLWTTKLFKSCVRFTCSDYQSLLKKDLILAYILANNLNYWPVLSRDKLNIYPDKDKDTILKDTK